MNSRLFHAVVVFCLSILAAPFGVFAQEDILIEPPLTWSINSIQIVWSVDQGATQQTKYIYSADKVNSKTFSKEQRTEKGKTTGNSITAGNKIETRSGLESNPFTLFGLLGSKVNASAYVEGGFNYNQTNRTTDTTLWSESEKNVVSKALTSAFEQNAQQTISKQRLVFTVDFVNHTDSQLEFVPRYENCIPISLGSGHIGKATPVGIKEAIISIPATGKPIPIEFEMPLDNSRKLALLNNRPQININNAQLNFRTSDGEPKIEGNIFRKSLITRGCFTVAILSGNEVKEWKIRFFERNPVTLQKALEAINQSERKKTDKWRMTIFNIKNSHLISVCKAPFKDENNSAWITELTVIEGDEIKLVNNPDSYLQKTPLPGDRYVFQMVSMEIKKLISKAKAGDAKAQYELAKRCFDGNGVPEDKTKAIKNYHLAAKQGHINAQFNLGMCYDHGTGVPEDKTEAVKWYQKAAEQGDSKAQVELADKYFDGEDVPEDKAEAVKWYRKAAEQGDKIAQNMLGYCYLEGKGIQQDYVEAVKWFHKAVEQEYEVAQCNLGHCYYKGNGIQQDYVEAVKWFRKAAEQGDEGGACCLGTCYYEGKGVQQDYEEAIKWFRKAAEQGDEVAQRSLGVLYYEGKGVQQDYEEAIKWFRKAAEQGDEVAQNNLGLCYFEGKGVQQDYKEAIKWYRKVLEQGNQAAAQINLGICYFEGKGVQRDYKEAVKWFSKAAEQGDEKGQYFLSECYYKGLGVPKNKKIAIEWLRKAADQEFEDAIKALKKIESSWW